MRESFVFYHSFYESIESLDNKDVQLELYRAIAKYSLDGEEIELSNLAKSMFYLIRPQLDANRKRYENGKRGGRPKNQQETVQEPKDNQDSTKEEANVNENVNENVNVLKNTSPSESECEEVYQLYPRKERKKDALRYIKRDVKAGLVSINELKKHVVEFANSEWVRTCEHDYIPHAGAWFYQRRWQDDHAEWHKPRAGPNQPSKYQQMFRGERKAEL